MTQTLPQEIDACCKIGLTPIPLKPWSKEALLRWGNGWNPTLGELKRQAARPNINWGVPCGAEMVGPAFDDPSDYQQLIDNHVVSLDTPISQASSKSISLL